MTSNAHTYLVNFGHTLSIRLHILNMLIYDIGVQQRTLSSSKCILRMHNVYMYERILTYPLMPAYVLINAIV